MPLLGPYPGVTFTPRKPESDGLGNLSWTDREPITHAVFALEAPSSSEDSVYSQGGSIFVPRGSVIENGDRVTYQGRTFVVIGPIQWDIDHPMTGDDFGYAEVKIQWGG